MGWELAVKVVMVYNLLGELSCVTYVVTVIVNGKMRETEWVK